MDINLLSEIGIGGTGIKHYYNGLDDIDTLSTRESIINNDDITHKLNKHIKNGQKIFFLPIDVNEVNIKNYQLRLFGILMNGAKIEVNITGIDVFFDVGIPTNISEAIIHNDINLMLKDTRISYWIENVYKYPLHGYHTTKKIYKRIFTNTVYERNVLLSIIKDQMMLETFSNDTSNYYRKAARENKFSLCDWVCIENYIYEQGPTTNSPHCEYIITVDKQFYKHLSNEKARNLPLINKDRTLIMAWDIETHSTRKTGEVPSPDNDEDNAFMICLTIHWLHDADALVKICIVDKDTESDNRWITIVCKSFVNILKAFAICWEHYKPDICIGYNDSGYDWPFVIEKAIKFDILVWMWKKMSSIQYRTITLSNIIKYNYNNGSKRKIKINAEKDFYSSILTIPGTICIDALPSFMKLYPRVDTNKYASLRYYLQDNNLPNKVDLPVQMLWKYYESGEPNHMREIAYYCIVDSISVQRLFVKRSVVSDYREISTLAYVSLSDSHYYAGGVKVCNLLSSYACDVDILIDMKPKYSSKVEKIPGAYVFQPDKGMTPNVDRLRALLESDDKENAIKLFAKDRPVSCLDFASLYPSLIMTYNLSPEKILIDSNEKEKWEKSHNLHTIEFTIGDKNIKAWSILHNNDEKHMGLFPKILLSLFNKRKEMKKLLNLCTNKIDLYEIIINKTIDDKYDESINSTINLFNNDIVELQKPITTISLGSTIEDEINNREKRINFIKAQIELVKLININTIKQDYSNIRFEKNCIDKKQNALKIYMNTFYGETGNHLSPFFLLQLAGGVTSAGQYNIKKVAEYAKNKGYFIKYGDSVMPYTPITLKVNSKKIIVTTFENIKEKWYDYSEFKSEDNDRFDKEFCSPSNYQIWTHNGWANVLKIIRHRTIKKIYRVRTNSGLIDVTEDHSLLTSDNKTIKPSDCIKTTQLLHSIPITINVKKYYVNLDLAFIYGMIVGSGIVIFPNIWIIINKDYKLLLLCKYILERLEDTKFDITECILFPFVYVLRPININDNLIEKYSICFTDEKIRIIPEIILNGFTEAINSFITGITRSTREGYLFNTLQKEFKYLYDTIIDSNDILLEINKKIPAITTMYSTSMLLSQMYITMFQKIGYGNIIVNYTNNIFKLIYNSNAKNDNFTSIVTLNSNYFGYVYDIETEHGSFHAGVGNIIVKNTDSLYLTCPNDYFTDCDTNYIAKKYTKEEYFSAMIKITLRMMPKFEQDVNEYLKNDNGTTFLKMENEGCYYPCLFLGKKKYFGIQHVNEVNLNSKKLYIKGLDVIKQGKSNIEKKIGYTIMERAVSLQNDQNIIDIVKEILTDSVTKKVWEFEDFIQTSSWKPTKANLAVHQFMKRMTARHEIELKENNMGKEIKELKYKPLEPGERFSYVLVKNNLLYNLQGKKITCKVGDIMEYSHIAKSENMDIDIIYYLIHYVIGICARFINSDKEFMPTNNTMDITDEKKIDEYTIKMAKKMLEEYINNLGGISKENITEQGRLCKSLFKTAVQINAEKIPNKYKHFISGPLIKIAFKDEENITDMIFSFANKSAESLYTKYCTNFCKDLCTVHNINYNSGVDIIKKCIDNVEIIEDTCKCTHLYKYINSTYNWTNNYEYKLRKRLCEYLPTLNEIIIQYKVDIGYIVDKLKKNETDIDMDFEYNNISNFIELWNSIIGFELCKLQNNKFYEYLLELKHKRIRMEKKPSKEEIDKIIKNIK